MKLLDFKIKSIGFCVKHKRDCVWKMGGYACRAGVKASALGVGKCEVGLALWFGVGLKSFDKKMTK